MGWKKVKEHYGIEHIVKVSTKREYNNEPCIFIGSSYIGDIIVIRMSDAALMKRYNKGWTNDKLRELQPKLDSDSKNGTLKRLIDATDEFGELLPVYCIDDGRHVVEMQCEAYGWPNITTSGLLMYDNTFFSSKDVAKKHLLRNSKISPFWWNHVKERFCRMWDEFKRLHYDIEEVWTYIYVRCWGRFCVKKEIKL